MKGFIEKELIIGAAGSAVVCFGIILLTKKMMRSSPWIRVAPQDEATKNACVRFT